MPGSSSRLRLLPAQRIKKGGDFVRLKSAGKRVTTPLFILNWMAREVLGPSRIGVVTSKRLGNAVHRNRARRLLRESFRLIQNRLLRPIDLVLVARPGIGGKDLHRVLEALLTTLVRAQLVAADSGTSKLPIPNNPTPKPE